MKCNKNAKISKPQQQKDDYDIDELIWGNIRRYQYLNHLTDEQLSESLGVSQKSLYNYNSDPSKLTLGRIRCFLDASGLTILDLVSY